MAGGKKKKVKIKKKIEQKKVSALRNSNIRNEHRFVEWRNCKAYCNSCNSFSREGAFPFSIFDAHTQAHLVEREATEEGPITCAAQQDVQQGGFRKQQRRHKVEEQHLLAQKSCHKQMCPSYLSIYLSVYIYMKQQRRHKVEHQHLLAQHISPHVY